MESISEAIQELDKLPKWEPAAVYLMMTTTFTELCKHVKVDPHTYANSSLGVRLEHFETWAQLRRREQELIRARIKARVIVE